VDIPKAWIICALFILARRPPNSCEEHTSGESHPWLSIDIRASRPRISLLGTQCGAQTSRPRAAALPHKHNKPFVPHPPQIPPICSATGDGHSHRSFRQGPDDVYSTCDRDHHESTVLLRRVSPTLHASNTREWKSCDGIRFQRGTSAGPNRCSCQGHGL